MSLLQVLTNSGGLPSCWRFSLLWPLMCVRASVWRERKKIILICFHFYVVLELRL